MVLCSVNATCIEKKVLKLGRITADQTLDHNYMKKQV